METTTTTETPMTLRQRAFAEQKRHKDAMKEQDLYQQRSFRKMGEDYLRQALAEKLGTPLQDSPVCAEDHPITWRAIWCGEYEQQTAYGWGYPTVLIDGLLFSYFTSDHELHLVAVQENGHLEDQGEVNNLIELAERIENMKEDPFASE